MIDYLKIIPEGGLRIMMARFGIYRQSHPRIRKIDSGTYKCFSSVGLYPVYGHGSTPFDAYSNWLSDMKRYSPEIAKEAGENQK